MGTIISEVVPILSTIIFDKICVLQRVYQQDLLGQLVCEPLG